MCSSCQNVIPQSASRCAVCGATPGISADDFIASLDPTSDPAGSAGSELSPGSGVATAPTDLGGPTAPSGRVFTPPPLPSSDQNGPPTEAASILFPQRRGSSRSTVASPTVDIDPFSNIKNDSNDEEGDTDEIVCTVRAISNRLDADIRIGRRSGHRFFVTAAPLAAGVALVFGTYSAYSFADLERPDRVEPSTEAAQPGTLAFGEEQASAAQGRAEDIASQVNEIIANNCGLPVTANAIALSPTRLVTTTSAVANDAQPLVRFADNSSRVGRVVGYDLRANLAVIEINEVAGTGNVQWGVTDRILDDPQVVVVERFGAAINGTPATVDQIDGVRGLINAFGFSGASFRPGSAVLNSDGFIIGMVDETGRSALGGNELSAAFGRVIARPSTPATSCPTAPAPDGAVDDTGEAAITE